MDRKTNNLSKLTHQLNQMKFKQNLLLIVSKISMKRNLKNLAKLKIRNQ